MSRLLLAACCTSSLTLLVCTAHGGESAKVASLPTVIYQKQDFKTSTALQQQIDVEMVETPLSDFLSFISDVIDVQIYLDPASLDDVGLSADEPVTIKLDGVPARQVLDLVLTKWGLTYIARENFILITDEDELVTRVYPVVDILHSKGTAGIATFVREYRELITQTISPDSWNENGGLGSISFSPANISYVITASPKVHAKIEDLFDDLRSAGTATEDWLQAQGDDEAKRWHAMAVGMLSEINQQEWLSKQQHLPSPTSSGIPISTPAVPATHSPAPSVPLLPELPSQGGAIESEQKDMARVQQEVDRLKNELKRLLHIREAENRR